MGLDVSSDSLFQDSRLVPSNLSNGGAKQRSMVMTKCSDSTNHRFSYNVGAVESSPYPNFDHRHLNPLLPENIESEDGEELEVRWSVILCKASAHAIINLPEVHREFGLFNWNSIDPDPLSGGYEMRRGVESRFEPLVSQDGFTKGAGGALALCPAHVDHLD